MTSQPSEGDPLLRPREAADRLGVHVETIWRWMRKGVMPFETLGPYRKKRVRASVVDSMVARGGVPHGT